MPPKFRDNLWSPIIESSNDYCKQKFLHGIQAKVFSSIKHSISILESSKDDETKTQIVSFIQMLCSNNLEVLFLNFDYKKSFLKLRIT